MMQLGAHYKMTLVYVNTDITVIVAHLVTTNKDELRKSLISMSLQNTVHGQSILKQVYQVAHSRWIRLPLQKNKLLKPAKKVEKINHVKLRLGFAMAVSLSLKEKMVQLFLV